jgi:hypothetical protein
MDRLGIEPYISELSSEEEVAPGLDGERDAFPENLSIMKRLL